MIPEEVLFQVFIPRIFFSQVNQNVVKQDCLRQFYKFVHTKILIIKISKRYPLLQTNACRNKSISCTYVGNTSNAFAQLVISCMYMYSVHGHTIPSVHGHTCKATAVNKATAQSKSTSTGYHASPTHPWFLYIAYSNTCRQKTTQT